MVKRDSPYSLFGQCSELHKIIWPWPLNVLLHSKIKKWILVETNCFHIPHEMFWSILIKTIKRHLWNCVWTKLQEWLYNDFWPHCEISRSFLGFSFFEWICHISSSSIMEKSLQNDFVYTSVILLAVGDIKSHQACRMRIW